MRVLTGVMLVAWLERRSRSPPARAAVLVPVTPVQGSSVTTAFAINDSDVMPAVSSAATTASNTLFSARPTETTLPSTPVPAQRGARNQQ